VMAGRVETLQSIEEKYSTSMHPPQVCYDFYWKNSLL
jgi:hypothetical protein